MTHWTERTYVENLDWQLPVLEQRAKSGDEGVGNILSLLEELYDVTPETVLDVGCGPAGRHVIPFAERGIEAHGLDVSPDVVERATDRAKAAGVADTTSFFACDMREIDGLTAQYELLLSMASFGFFEEDTNKAVLELFYERLEPGGVLLLRTANKEGNLVNFEEVRKRTVEEVTYVNERQYDPLTSKLHLEGLVIENETVQGEYEFNLRLYTPIEMKQLFSDTGFEDIRLYESLDGEKVTRESEGQVILGRK